ncbi:IPT/TIG domain-containing protein [Mucilaginibacter ginkgonis]|uniref:IPT/TIG domain-containing protein n=1 Tax=Mucilaginibacter ginkgonis TaxID=2682091 RepID=A0A6I4I0I3_9SPHI|nr:IPT/TIG domain-containing protein [Mucilaginibacter ginkgonis]QQL48619.1 IPT/TIG domain-containing protein [Mucilaginibacter ginkgonis]
MKYLNLTPKLILMIAIALLAVTGCKKSGSVDPVPAPAPAITAISVSTAVIGSTVTITGTNFGSDITKDTVRFNGVAATISSANTTSIVVTVPATATTGKISVVTDGKTLIYPTDFTVTLLVPTITGATILPTSYGGSISIKGSNFDPNASKNTVVFAGIKALVASASSSEIIAQITTTTSITSGPVQLTSYGTTLTYTATVTVIPALGEVMSTTSMGYLAVDAAGNIYGESGNSVYKVTPAKVTSLLATAGNSANVPGNPLRGTAVDAAGNVYATGTTDAKIYKITPNGVVSTFAGSGVSAYVDGKGTAAQFIAPVGLAIDPSGNLFVCDSARVRKIAPDGTVSTFAGSATSGTADGQGAAASFNSLIAMTADFDGNLFVTNSAGTIRKITPTGLVSTLNLQGPLVTAGGYNQPITAHGIYGGNLIAADPFGNLIVCNNYGIVFGNSSPTAGVAHPVYIIDKSGLVAQYTTADLVSYQGVTADRAGNIYIGRTFYGGPGPEVYKYYKK